MTQDAFRILSPGKVLIDYGPVTMVVMAFKNDEPLTQLCVDAFEVVENALKEITASLTYLRLPPQRIPQGILQGLPLQMLEAVLAVGEPTLTPMATVAGTIAQFTCDWLFEQGATRAITNNGGDIALRLAPGEKVRVGIISDLSQGVVDTIVTVDSQSGIGGIATSGLGGRSFTRGIASAVSVFAPNCIWADALATHLANQTYVPSDQITRVKAGTLDPMSDIADLDVVVEVGQLSEAELTSSLANLSREAKKQYESKLFLGLCANVQNRHICYPEGFLQQIT